MRYAALSLLLVPFIAACASARPAQSGADEAVRLTVAGSPADVAHHVAAAFGGEGLALDEVGATLVRSRPFLINPQSELRTEAVVRATVQPRGDSTEVFIVGSIRQLGLAAPMAGWSDGRHPASESAVTAQCRAACAEAWQRMEKLAGRIAAAAR